MFRMSITGFLQAAFRLTEITTGCGNSQTDSPLLWKGNCRSTQLDVLGELRAGKIRSGDERVVIERLEEPHH
jgi:hypothetical protein